jgi:hypothetical protein
MWGSSDEKGNREQGTVPSRNASVPNAWLNDCANSVSLPMISNFGFWILD